MAVYFDHRLDSAGPSGINTDVSWYSGGAALVAVASYNEDTGGTLNIFSEEVSRPYKSFRVGYCKQLSLGK